MVTEFNDRGKFFTNVISKDPVQVIIQTTHQRIIGEVHVRRGERLKDELNQPDQFIAVTNASVLRTDGNVELQTKLLLISSAQIVWVMPANEIMTAGQS